MKKILLFTLFTITCIPNIFADTNGNAIAAQFLADKGIINQSDDYNLDTNITRREMLKVMVNLSGNIVLGKQCRGDFSDLSESDWGCKYAEEALERGFIAKNENFRPDDFVTEVEALKMISQATSMDTYENESNGNWWDKYLNGAKYFGVLNDYDSVTISYSQRSKVFYMTAKTFSDIGEGVIVEGIYEHCYPAGGPVPCIKIDQKQYPLVHTNGGFILIDRELSKNLGDIVEVEILEQNRWCNVIDSVGCNVWSSKIEVVDSNSHVNTFELLHK